VSERGTGLRRILITGANRGIGLEMVERYMARGDAQVFATCRNPAGATALMALAEQHAGRLTVLGLDVTDQAAVERALGELGAQVDGLDVLYNNAGIFPGGVDAREGSSAIFGQLEAAAMLEVFRVNTVAPVIMVQAAADLLRRGTNARVINMSSDVGSLTLRDKGGNYSYPSSKTALNMMTRSLAGDLRGAGVIVVSMHPGWIQTEMGGKRAALTLDEAVPRMMQVVDGLTLEDSGLFFQWDGTRVPW
jgi:NAD(P)-dependent dehydrogenase (short-subunit alcohol dehydrogenase family)